MNTEQETTLTLLVLFAVLLIITAERTIKFWQAVFTPQPWSISPPSIQIKTPLGDIVSGGKK